MQRRPTNFGHFGGSSLHSTTPYGSPNQFRGTGIPSGVRRSRIWPRIRCSAAGSHRGESSSERGQRACRRGGRCFRWQSALSFLPGGREVVAEGGRTGGGVFRLAEVLQFLVDGHFDQEALAVLLRMDLDHGVAADRLERAFQSLVGVGRIVVPRFQQRPPGLGNPSIRPSTNVPPRIWTGISCSMRK